MKVLSVAEMRIWEERASCAGLNPDRLMENAGLAVAEEIIHRFGGVSGKRVLCLIGPGNNGGDGLVAARHLHLTGAKVVIYMLSERAALDDMLGRVKGSIQIISPTDDPGLNLLNTELRGADIVLDAVFGTGISRPITGNIKEILERLSTIRRQSNFKLVALDLPSGFNADTGQIDPATPTADYTLALGAPKCGFFCFPGAEYIGQLSVIDIGIPAGLDECFQTDLMTPEKIRSMLPHRPRDGHKGIFGRLMVVAGSPNYIGAAYLTCMGAYRAGAGLVTLASAASVYKMLAAKLIEPTHLCLPEDTPGNVSDVAVDALLEALSGYDALLVGPGLGDSWPLNLLVDLIKNPASPPGVVIDADALNKLSQCQQWWQVLAKTAILTPHPAELSRLSALPVNQILNDRIGVTRRLSVAWRQVVVLKGAFTLVASPDGRVSICPFTNPALATAGTGDVLAGAIAGLIAQGLSAIDAAVCGVYIHALSGQNMATRLGDAGVIASDLLPELPMAIKELKSSG